MQDKKVLQGYEYAKEIFGEKGVDIDAAIKRADGIAVSMHCWQGDDVIGFDGLDSLSGGIATTGNYPGRATTPQQLRADADAAISMIPGTLKFNLHASYAEKGGRNIDRDAYTIADFQNWVDWAKEKGMGMDFNPTYFSHPKMDGNFSLSSLDEGTRRFWIEHGKRCKEIAAEMGRQLGKPCCTNYWMPDGTKDTCADTSHYRDIMTKSLDEIFESGIDMELAPCAIESKLFGIGVESYTVASHEYALLYAATRGLLYTLDAGHYHPTEYISAKISALLSFMDKTMLHVSRGIRWDSDHIITLDDELQRIMDEVIYNNYDNRVLIGLDFFDASVNRVAAWVIGVRNARKALLNAALSPAESIKKAELEGDTTLRLALMEERRTLPLGAVWDYYCAQKNVPVGEEWIAQMKAYEKDVLASR